MKILCADCHGSGIYTRVVNDGNNHFDTMPDACDCINGYRDVEDDLCIKDTIALDKIDTLLTLSLDYVNSLENKELKEMLKKTIGHAIEGAN